MILKRRNVEREASSEIEIAALKAVGFKEIANAGEESSAGDKPVDSVGPADDAKSIDDMTVAELRSYATERGIEGAGALSKADLLAMLKE